MKKFWRNNNLSIVFFFLFLVSLCGQIFTGFKEYNKERTEVQQELVTLPQYLSSGHFLQSTFENWESEFLQMAMFLLLSVKLFQAGSSESKDPENGEAANRASKGRKPNVPWPVKKGGWVLKVYEHSLSGVFFLFFILSFIFHFVGSRKDFNQHQKAIHHSTETIQQYLVNSRFWFESLQNWQSEFLSIFAIVFFSIFLREKGSPQSKPVDAPDSQTGS